MEDEKYLNEIYGIDWITEMIDERFDNALSFMTGNSIIYGGAIRDIVAGLPMEGDLDMSVSRFESESVLDKVIRNPRWVMKTDKAETGGKDLTYEQLKDKNIVSDVMSFENGRGRVLQVISSASNSKDSFEAALYTARKVDIVCCGLVLTHDGRLFEVVPNAFKDCKNRVLTLNEPALSELDRNTVLSRVNKLVARGWKNEIDVDRIPDAPISKITMWPEHIDDPRKYVASRRIDKDQARLNKTDLETIANVMIDIARRARISVIVTSNENYVSYSTRLYTEVAKLTGILMNYLKDGTIRTEFSHEEKRANTIYEAFYSTGPTISTGSGSSSTSTSSDGYIFLHPSIS